MEKRRLTERRIESLSFDPSGSTRQFGWDTDVPGFGVRLYQSGRKCYVLQYWLTGRRRLMQLGEAGVMPLEQARELARAARAKVNQDIDPLMERTTARQEREEAGTLSELIGNSQASNWSGATGDRLPTTHSGRACRHQQASRCDHEAGRSRGSESYQDPAPRDVRVGR